MSHKNVSWDLADEGPRNFFWFPVMGLKKKLLTTIEPHIMSMIELNDCLYWVVTVVSSCPDTNVYVTQIIAMCVLRALF